ncbi:hypothetical protein, partial [Bradyrhizobium sp.]|uniref:hypothetical protein n=1 Tax=Bradyrhizobium sp. TaxID=376 RepID=UPI00391B5A53
MASYALQSRVPPTTLDCFASLAMTEERTDRVAPHSIWRRRSSHGSDKFKQKFSGLTAAEHAAARNRRTVELPGLRR